MYKKAFAVLALAIVVAAGLFISMNHKSNTIAVHKVSSVSVAQDESGPVSLDGTWTQSSSGIPGIKMTATISDNKISIGMNTGSDTGTYWIGSFDTLLTKSQSFTVTSTGDVSAMEGDLLASQDSSKVFTYKNGYLSFPFSIMGVNTTVHLQRSSQ